MPDQSPNAAVRRDVAGVAADAACPERSRSVSPGRQATASTTAESKVPLCSPVPSVVDEVPPRPSAPSAVNPTFLRRELRDNDLTTLRANIKSLVIKNLLASPFLTRFYVDSVISNFPNSNAAKILARNYQKIMNRISMPNPKSCTHIKVTGVRCQSPALRGEQFCYFHQHAHRGVRRPPHSRLHPIALIESEEAIQASLMEVINGLIRNTLDVKRAELIIRALHIAVKNARHTRFDSNVYPKVREVPQYAEPESDNVKPGAINADEYLPAVAAVPYKPVDPRDPHFLERMEEGGRVLARQPSERQAAKLRDDARRAARPHRASSPKPAPRSARRTRTVATGSSRCRRQSSCRDSRSHSYCLHRSAEAAPPFAPFEGSESRSRTLATQAAAGCESGRQGNRSSEGAQECSPARKRWVESNKEDKPQRGARKNCLAGRDASAAGRVALRASHPCALHDKHQ